MNMHGQKINNFSKKDSPSSSFHSSDFIRLAKDNILEDKEVEEVKILTYNLFMRPPFVKNNEDDYKNERCKLIIQNEIQKFDIICFQELFRLFSNRRHKMVYSAIKKGFLYHVSSPQPNFFKSYFVDAGLTILSKYPIVESCFRPFRYGILADGLCQKGVLYAKIRVNERHIHVLNTHTQASYNTNEKEIVLIQKKILLVKLCQIGIVPQNFINNYSILAYSNFIVFNKKQTVIARLDQFVEMRKILEDCLKQYGFERGDICIFAGDFNVDSNHPIHPIKFLDKQQDLKEILGISDTQQHFDEYKGLIDILSSKGKDIIQDVGRSSNSGNPPITFADVYQDQNGEIQPLETALTHQGDLKSLQSLDYIMHIMPNGLLADCQNKLSFSNNQQSSKYLNQTLKGGYSYQLSSNKSIQNSSKKLSDKNFVVDFSRSKVEKFFLQGQKFTQLSDHYGVSCVLKYK
ncbi:hypothetical protein ABPG72_004433 [Tetrahymena utriculariae]